MAPHDVACIICLALGQRCILSLRDNACLAVIILAPRSLGRQGAFPEHLPFIGPGGRGRRSARSKGRQVIAVGLWRTRRSNFGGDPSTTGAKRLPNSRDGARWDAAFQKESGHPVRS